MRDEIEARLRDLARRAGLAGVPPAAVAAALCLAAVAVAAGVWRWWPRESGAGAMEVVSQGAAASVTTRPAGGTGAAAEASASAGLLVHVVGSVRHPGVYELPAGSRVIDAVDAAGGLLPDGVAEAVNFARQVADGEQIVIPSLDDVASGNAPVAAGSGGGGAAVAGAPASGAPIDLNSADAAALDSLPGVGPSTAQKIVADREANGRFASVEDLGRVSGIGPKKLEQLKDLVCVR